MDIWSHSVSAAMWLRSHQQLANALFAHVSGGNNHSMDVFKRSFSLGNISEQKAEHTSDLFQNRDPAVVEGLTSALDHFIDATPRSVLNSQQYFHAKDRPTAHVHRNQS